jgi:tocopherol O-methyltransferase
MTTSFSQGLTSADIKNKVQKFYDVGSPLYLDLYGRHIHDGYYITGHESKEEAQENLIRLIVEKAAIKKGATVLDVGCGVGGSSIWLAANLGAATTGITLSPVQVDIARKLAAETGANSTFMVMDAENMHFETTFDVVWVVAAMTHFQDQERFISQAARYLNPQGKLVIFDWMSAEGVADTLNDRYLRPVSAGMLLASMHPLNTYLSWVIRSGLRISYAEDITRYTIKTWDDALTLVKGPAVLKLAYTMTREYKAEALQFLKSLGAMKRAMLKHKIIAGTIVAEKL